LPELYGRDAQLLGWREARQVERLQIGFRLRGGVGFAPT